MKITLQLCPFTKSFQSTFKDLMFNGNGQSPTRKAQIKTKVREFAGGLMIRILGFHCCGLGSVPGQGTEILQAPQRGQKTKTENKGKKKN